MATRMIEYENSTNNIRSDLHLIAGRLCSFPKLNANCYQCQDSLSNSFQAFHFHSRCLSDTNSDSSITAIFNSHGKTAYACILWR